MSDQEKSSIEASKIKCPCNEISSFSEAAVCWFEFGFNVIPIVPDTKQPAVKWDPWLEKISAERIAYYWSKNPDHQIGFIVSDDYLVLDADSPESVAAIWKIEKEFSEPPRMVVTTKKGEHHYFKRSPDTTAKTSSHSTKQYPERIDVKTGRSLVVLPPSTGKSFRLGEAKNADDLGEVGQDFIDAVYKHNGVDAPRLTEKRSVGDISPKSAITPRDRYIPKSLTLDRIKLLLEHFDPDCGYDEWLKILMIVFYESDGDEEGFSIADDWSSRGSQYQGTHEIETKWNSFSLGEENHYTFHSLMKMADERGIDWLEICDALEPQFEICEYVVVNTQNESIEPTNPLDSFSLRGQSKELEKTIAEQIPILGQLALKAQAAVFYAAPNTGKTLITLNRKYKTPN